MSDLIHLSGRTNLARMTGTTSLVDLDIERRRRQARNAAEVSSHRSRRRTAPGRAGVEVRARTVLGRDGPDAA